MNFGEAIRRKRQQKGWTMKDLAYWMGGYTECYVSLIETGKREITPQLVKRIVNKRCMPELWGEAIAYLITWLAQEEPPKQKPEEGSHK